MSRRFGRRVHTVLRNLVDAAGRRVLVGTERADGGARPLSHLEGLFYFPCHVCLSENHRLGELLAGGKLGSYGGGECASRSVGVVAPHMVAAECLDGSGLAQHI